MIKSHLFTYQDASLFKERVIDTWKPASDVWPFIHGDDALGTLTILEGTTVTYTFRKALNLRPYARVTCYAPVLGLPALGCYMFHKFIITTDVLTTSSCPLCISLKASLSQSLFGVAFPLLFAPIVCFYLADRCLTYPVPPLLRAPKEVFSLFKKIVVKSYRPFLIIGAVQIAAAWFITYKKETSFHWIKSVLNQNSSTHAPNDVFFK